MLIPNHTGSSLRRAHDITPEAPILALTTFHLKSLKSLLQLLMDEVEFLEQLTPSAGPQWGFDTSLEQRLELVEKELIREALRTTGGHQTRAAKILNIGTTTLNAKLKRFGIDPRLFIDLEGDVQVAENEES